jgi:hypothetical protein
MRSGLLCVGTLMCNITLYLPSKRVPIRVRRCEYTVRRCEYTVQRQRFMYTVQRQSFVYTVQRRELTFQRFVYIFRR